MSFAKLDLKSETHSILGRLGVDAAMLSGGSLDARSPVTGQSLASLRECSAADVVETVGRAHAAFLEWRLVPAPKRGELVRLLGEELLDRPVAVGFADRELVAIAATEQREVLGQGDEPRAGSGSLADERRRAREVFVDARRRNHLHRRNAQMGTLRHRAGGAGKSRSGLRRHGSTPAKARATAAPCSQFAGAAPAGGDAAAPERAAAYCAVPAPERESRSR